MNPIYDVLTSLFKPVGDYFNRKQELKAQAHENDVKVLAAQGERQAQLIKDGLAADAAWEMEFARQAAGSWKDEFELIVVAAPAILCFIHTKMVDGATIVAEGFKALNTTPAWFQFVLVSIFLANYGIRYWRKTQSDT